MSKVEGFVSYIWNLLVMWLLLSFEHGVHHSVGHFLPVASTRTNHASGRREDWVARETIYYYGTREPLILAFLPLCM